MERRNFIKTGTMAAAAFGFPTIVPASVFGQNAPSNRITVAMIGTGRQGYGQNLQGAKVENVPGMLDIPMRKWSLCAMSTAGGGRKRESSSMAAMAS